MAGNRFLKVDADNFPYVFLKNADIPLKTYETGLLRCNVYLPKDAVPFGRKTYPVIATMVPVRAHHGKEVPYESFFKKSWDQLSPGMKSPHAAWETPDPGFWTSKGYIVVRADERGAGQSPGELDTMSCGTSETFFDVVEWCAEQEWSSGKVGLLGISYYAGTQWRVAARKPKGLAAIIPWEGMSDYYSFWWNNCAQPNQYGMPGRAARKWGDDTLEGNLTEAELVRSRRDPMKDTAVHKFMDEEYYKSRTFDLGAIEVPLLSVANWGGILLHLRGNIVEWMRASSQHKFLRFILQLSFLDSFLKDNDHDGWKSGQQPPVHICLRKGDCGIDDPERELNFPSRPESDWPIPDTQYTKYFLTADQTLSTTPGAERKMCTYDAMNGEPINFSFKTPTQLEITGRIIARLRVSCKEVFYTGTMGDPVPVVKGWLRVSLRKVEGHPFHRPYLPYRDYFQSDVQEVRKNEKYDVDVEVWPTNTVLEEGETLVLEIAGHDTQGLGKFSYEHPEDRSPEVFHGYNTVEVGGDASFLVLPVIPSR
ncbi:Alpha/Beta hydrolase protein [Aspergillus desertorum]